MKITNYAMPIVTDAAPACLVVWVKKTGDADTLRIRLIIAGVVDKVSDIDISGVPVGSEIVASACFNITPEDIELIGIAPKKIDPYNPEAYGCSLYTSDTVEPGKYGYVVTSERLGVFKIESVIGLDCEFRFVTYPDGYTTEWTPVSGRNALAGFFTRNAYLEVHAKSIYADIKGYNCYNYPTVGVQIVVSAVKNGEEVDSGVVDAEAPLVTLP